MQIAATVLIILQSDGTMLRLASHTEYVSYSTLRDVTVVILPLGSAAFLLKNWPC